MKMMLLVIGAVSLAAFDQPSAQPKPAGPVTPLTAKLTSLNGASRAIVLDGVGCSVSMCSRIVIKGKAEDGSLVEIPLAKIASIKDSDVFVTKDGVERRLSLVKDFRVLYFTDPDGGTGKVDLSKIKSIEFGR
jgi:hypothetical protein